ncbi:hypothetical protein J6590_019496 [Homalodisca vitripennis]|nr:hypothetical protein J6590_019496 [Homalodisca vitripennis]
MMTGARKNIKKMGEDRCSMRQSAEYVTRNTEAKTIELIPERRVAGSFLCFEMPGISKNNIQVLKEALKAFSKTLEENDFRSRVNLPSSFKQICIQIAADVITDQ